MHKRTPNLVSHDKTMELIKEFLDPHGMSFHASGQLMGQLHISGGILMSAEIECHVMSGVLWSPVCV